MKFSPMKLPGAYRIDLEPQNDFRGGFARLFCAREMKEIGLDKRIVNVNHSSTLRKGTVRGLHFQYPPSCEIKIVKCIRGAVWDCIVDVRKNSPTFLKWDAVELTEENDRMVYVPEGFAHGLQALEDNAEVLYFLSEFYAPQYEGGLRFDDPDLKIDWPSDPTSFSHKDGNFPLLAEKGNWEGVELP